MMSLESIGLLGLIGAAAIGWSAGCITTSITAKRIAKSKEKSNLN